MMVYSEAVSLPMLELIQAVHILAGVFILAILAIILFFGFRGLCLPKTFRPYTGREDSYYGPLPRKISF